MTQAEIIERLQAGNDRFVADKMDGQLQDSNRRLELTHGQEPYAIVLSCADSRVVPEFAFDTGLGELFVIRVAGNVATTESIASIEYAVANIGTSVLLVLGHQSCGAVTAAIKGGNNGYNLNQLLSHITPAIAQAGPDADIDTVVKLNAQLTVQDLRERSHIIDEAAESGKLQVHPAYYNLESGKIDILDQLA